MLPHKKQIRIFLVFLVVFLFVLLLVPRMSYSIESFHNPIPRVIWVYWNTDILPLDIQAIQDNNDRVLSPSFTIRILDEKTLGNWLDLNSFPDKYGQLKVQAQSDYIRLRLLNAYGGVYADASVIFNDKEAVGSLFEESDRKEADLLAFTLDPYDPSYPFHQFIESWFLMAPAGSPIIDAWLTEFERAIDMGFDTYTRYIQKEEQIRICPNIRQFGSYLVVHMALQTVLQRGNIDNPNLILHASETDMYRIMVECNNEAKCMTQAFQDRQRIRQIPYIKINGQQRKIIRNLADILTDS